MPPTEYAARQPRAEKSEEPVTVLVTGFGPFLSKVPINSSWEIASRLPALIPASPENKTPIHIHVHHEPIRVAYQPVHALIPTLLPPTNPSFPPPAIVLHIGLAAGRTYYAIEDRSRRNIYDKIPDVDGEVFSDKSAFAGCPEVLRTGFDVGDVLGSWRLELDRRGKGGDGEGGGPGGEGKADVRISQNAGNFLCGFMYYNSLAHYFSLSKKEKEEKGQGKEEGERPVVFLHVPDLSGSEEKLKEGVEVTSALIKALVESRREVGVLGKQDDEEEEKEKEKEKEKVNGNVAQTDNNFA